MITIDKLKQVFAKKGYSWSTTRPNLIGIRTTLQVPDIFNDIFVCVWTQPTMPSGLSVIAQQKWLNSWGYVGKNQKLLVEDGSSGENTIFAINAYKLDVGKERIKMWTITTDPGTYWLNNPMGKLGTAVLKPGQYLDSHSIGFHQNKTDHKALVQTGKLTVYRDNDKDNIAEATSITESGLFGINVHRSNKIGATPKIGQWSGGCQTFQSKTDHDKLMQICENYRVQSNKFTLTLIEEIDL